MDKLTYEQAVYFLRTNEVAMLKEDPQWKAKEQYFMRDAWCWCAFLAEYKHNDENGKDFTRRQIMSGIYEVWTAMMREWLYNVPSDETTDDAAALLISSMYDAEKWSAEQEAALQKHTDPYLLLDAFVHLAAARIFNAKIFERLLEVLNFTWDQVESYYKEMEDEPEGNAKDDGAHDNAPPDRPAPQSMG